MKKPLRATQTDSKRADAKNTPAHFLTSTAALAHKSFFVSLKSFDPSPQQNILTSVESVNKVRFRVKRGPLYCWSALPFS